MKNKVFLQTFGCQMNVRDSEVIRGLLKKNGYKITEDAAGADIILFNTCSVRQHAEDKVWSAIGRFKTGKPGNRQTRQPIIGLIGCMAQLYKETIFERAPNVDFVVGPSNIHKIPVIIKQLSTIDHRPSTRNFFERKVWETDGRIRPEEIYHTGFYEDEEHAYVVISEGCSNYCSYCVVPYVRGELHNRNYKDILKEIEEAVDRGITRITLLGQNVNAYVSNSKFKIQNSKLEYKLQNTQEQLSFVDLLKMVNQINGLKEFSFITSHPRDTSLDLFKAMADLARLKKYLHLPVQSGSDYILKLMNRGYSRKFYLDLVENYRKIVKDGVLTTDIIVGFPSEKEEDFKNTYDLVNEVRFNAAFIFKYSPRMNTQAANFADDVEKKEKERRHSLILELQKKISKKINE